MKISLKIVAFLICHFTLSAQNDYKSTISSTFVYFKELYQFRTNDDFFFIRLRKDSTKAVWYHVKSFNEDLISFGKAKTKRYKRVTNKVLGAANLYEITDWQRIRKDTVIGFFTAESTHLFRNTKLSDDYDFIQRSNKFKLTKLNFLVESDLNSLKTKYPDIINGGVFDLNPAEHIPKYVIEYPIHHRQMGIHGRILIRFVVSASGKISDIKIFKGLEPEFDKEAEKFIEDWAKYKWNPEYDKPTYYMYSVVYGLEYDWD